MILTFSNWRSLLRICLLPPKNLCPKSLPTRPVPGGQSSPVNKLILVLGCSIVQQLVFWDHLVKFFCDVFLGISCILSHVTSHLFLFHYLILSAECFSLLIYPSWSGSRRQKAKLNPDQGDWSSCQAHWVRPRKAAL